MRLVRPHGDAVLVTSVRQAKRALRSALWRAAIVDIGLPDGSGLDLIEWIRSVRPLTPVLVLSGRCDPDVVNRVYDLAAEYVVKPQGGSMRAHHRRG
jgi:DNA-binding response OmpR family regulator